MRVRFMIVLLAVVVSACAEPGDGPARTDAALPTTVAATAPTSPVRRPPAGLTPASRRKAAPALKVTDFEGQTVSLDGFRGQPVVVSFFESWCGVCQVEQPDLTQVANEFNGRAGFVGVSNHDTVAAGRVYQRRFRVPYPLANDSSGRTWARWEVPYQPVTVLVDRQGRIAQRYDGGTTGGTLRAALAYLISE
jgi:peroxiredoxin